MTTAADLPAAPEPISAKAPARAVIEGQVAMLTRLAQIGMEIAEDCGRQSADQAADPSAALSLGGARDPGLAFARVARAVRMTIALQSRLLKDLADLDRADAIDAQARRDERRMRLGRLVDSCAEATVAARRDAAHAVQGRYWDPSKVEAEIEHLSEEAYERLTDAEDGHDLMGRPFAEVVAAICEDLGLDPDWTDRLLAATTPPTVEVVVRRPDPDRPSPGFSPPVVTPVGAQPACGAQAQGP